MKALHISGRADPGGGPEHMYQLTKRLEPGITLWIACPREEPYWERFVAVFGSRVLEIPHRKISLASIFQLAGIVKKEKMDVVHAHGRAAGIYGRLIALIAGRPCVFTAHGATPDTLAKAVIYGGVDYVLSIITAAVVAVSWTESLALKKFCFWKKRLHVIPNGVEIPHELPPAGMRITSPYRVLHVTRFVYQKNSEMLLEIMSHLKERKCLDQFRFLILGTGAGMEGFVAKARAFNLEPYIEFCGALPSITGKLQEAFCMLSTSRWEGLPLALLEAMASGVPVIASDVPGNSDAVVHNETGFLFPLPSAESAADRLMELSRELDQWKKLSLGARERAEKLFSVGAMVSETQRLYEKVA